MLKVEPVKKYKKPAYPVKDIIIKNPKLLKSLPQRWKGNLYVGIALSSLAAVTLIGCCDTKGRDPDLDNPSQTDISNSGNQNNVTINKNEGEGKVSPVFLHGDGRGGFGCVSVAPPAFLSEEEALQVVNEVFMQEGVEFKKQIIAFDKIKVPQMNVYQFKEDDEKIKYQEKQIVLDGYNNDKKTGFEFVSTDDIKSWHVNNNTCCSVESYYTKEGAEALRQSLNKNTGDVNVGILYEPTIDFGNKDVKDIINSDISFNEMEQRLKEINKEELKKQVLDFLEWLKGEGII